MLNPREQADRHGPGRDDLLRRPVRCLEVVVAKVQFGQQHPVVVRLGIFLEKLLQQLDRPGRPLRVIDLAQNLHDLGKELGLCRARNKLDHPVDRSPHLIGVDRLRIGQIPGRKVSGGDPGDFRSVGSCVRSFSSI